jgi:hypothetical protein
MKVLNAAAAAALGNIVVVLAASFGLHLSVDQLAATAAVVAGIFGVLVHAGVIPVTKVDNVKAGLVPTIKGKASVLDSPMVGQSDAKMANTPDPLSPTTRTPFGNN